MDEAEITKSSNEAELRRLFDIAGAVGYLQQIGANSATPTFVRSIIARGEVPHLRIGKKFFVSRESLDAWLARRERRR
jgi:excisionase family DNA binding protein